MLAKTKRVFEIATLTITLGGCGGVSEETTLKQGLSGTAELTPKLAKSLKWVAMGDSYSAGNGEYKKSTYCNRDSAIAYPFQAMNLINGSGGSTTISSLNHTACSAAKIGDIIGNQLDAIETDKPDVVTMTVGGNDAGFIENIAECMVGSCWQVEDMPKKVGTTWTEVEDRLFNLYVHMRARMFDANPTGKLYVLSYPVFFDPDVRWIEPRWFSCIAGISYGEARQINAAAVRMSDTIARAVQRANTYWASNGLPALADVRFVDWRPPVAVESVPEAVGWFFGYLLGWHSMNNAYDPNGLCADVDHPGTPLAMTPPWLYLMTDPDGRDETWHPTRLGYQVAAQRLTNSILSDF